MTGKPDGSTPPPLSAYPKEVQEAVMAIFLKGARRLLEMEKQEAKRDPN